MKKSKQVIIIAGPTASGKSGLAADLAALYNGCIMNADSLQLYKDLAILTACPSPKELDRAPHRLYGLLKGDIRCSVMRWKDMVLQELTQAFVNHLQPIIVGGTGLYLQALIEGLSPVPEVSDSIRQQVDNELKNEGLEALYISLTQEDPGMAKKLHPHDRQRIIRALCVKRATGKSLKEWHDEGKVQVPEYQFRKLLILPPREHLYQLADERLDAMMVQGALGEVQELLKQNYPKGAPIFKALGVGELIGYLQHKISREEAIFKAKTATRHYIKRQYTWFRGQFNPDFTLFCEYSRQHLGSITEFLNS